jgi:catechol 2,3-dioxygenase-like lactoylglutathione lyase family enzyme
MITGINHAGLVVKDLEKALEFYHGLLGLKVLARRERDGGPIDKVVGYDSAHLIIANVGFDQHTSIELIQYANPPPDDRPTEERAVLGGSHICFDVDDIEEAHLAIVAGGAVGLNPPVEVAPGRKVCYMQDPDGNWIELIESS